MFTAVPAADYYFAKWSDGNTENPRTITISNKDVTIKAQFAQMLLLTISASDNGTIETDVNGRYAPGSNVTITAKPNNGCGFMGWSDGSTDNPRTITIGNKDVSLTALFFAPTVDLGLESGTLWATRNLGAAKPWEYGDYYAWGETETKDDYHWGTYKYCKGSAETLTKYCYDAKYGNDGFTDNITTLLPEDDAATAVLGSDYSMPTVADWGELYTQCYWVWTNYNNQGVSGYIVYKAKAEGDKGTRGGTPSASYSLSDSHIFLPAAGYRDDTGLNRAGSFGGFWSASLFESRPNKARFCNFSSSLLGPTSSNNRDCGFSVRPVKRP